MDKPFRISRRARRWLLASPLVPWAALWILAYFTRNLEPGSFGAIFSFIHVAVLLFATIMGATFIWTGEGMLYEVVDPPPADRKPPADREL